MAGTVYRSGFIAIVGRPNVGKSTLLNAMVREKVSIVSNRPQTTRSRLMGIVGGEDYQMVFVDTPGIHEPRTRLGDYMMQAVQDGMEGMDILLVMADATDISHADRQIAAEMAKKRVPVFLLLNKIDLTEPKELLRIMDLFRDCGFEAILPISAKKGDGLEILLRELKQRLPEGPKYFPDDMLTDQPERVLCAELIRENALLHLRDEVPHGIGVEILRIENKNDRLTEIHADIYCEKESHKSIIIGKKGAMLALIGKEARLDIEALLGTRVNLQLWVRVRPDWRNSRSDLRTLGYDRNE